MTNGSVSANPASAAAGAQVTLTVSPHGGYQLTAGSLAVKNASNGPVTATPGSGNTYPVTLPSGGVTVAAAFETVPASTYTISIPSMENGTVTASHDSTTAGTTVTLTVTPASGDYQLQAGSLKVTKSGNVDVPVNGDGPYTFTMPASHVTVAAVFEEKVEEVPPGYIAIDNAETLAKIGVDTTNYPLNGKYFQTKNITIETPWTPIGPTGNRFSGEYNGNNKTITLNNIQATSHFGIFGYTDGATLKKIHVEGTITTSSGSIGGIVYTGVSTNFTDCSNAATLNPANHSGGICYNLSGTSTIDHCWNTGEIESNGGNAGGICGAAASGSAGNVVIQNCYNTGSITNVGGATGGIVASLNVAKAIACYNTGTLTGTGKNSNVGGIAGVFQGNSNGNGDIIACYNTGTVTASANSETGGKIYLGGIAGTSVTGTAVATASYNTGTVSWTGTGDEGAVYTGGIIGFFTKDENNVAVACYWTASSGPVHGIGYITTSATEGTDTGTYKFNNNVWPSAGGGDGQHNAWGIGQKDGSGSGHYWASLGSSPSNYPRLWFEN
jgi:hypothetical protein